MWFVMMSAMMAPTVWPWVSAVQSPRREYRWFLERLRGRVADLLRRRRIDPTTAAASPAAIDRRGDPLHRRRLSIRPVQARLPDALPQPAHLFPDALARRRLRRIPNGLPPRPVLRRLLLGADGNDACNRRDEFVVDVAAWIVTLMEQVSRGETRFESEWVSHSWQVRLSSYFRKNIHRITEALKHRTPLGQNAIWFLCFCVIFCVCFLESTCEWNRYSASPIPPRRSTER